MGTNYGVSAKFYETVLKRPPTEFDMRNITQEKAHKLFKEYFWDKMQGDNIKSQVVADMLIDHGINSYPSTATKIISRQKPLSKQDVKRLAIQYFSREITRIAVK